MPERWTPAYDRLFQDDHDFGEDPACQRWAWLDLCHMAQFKDGVRVISGSVIELPRGSLLASVRFLAKRWGWSKTKVARFLTALQHPKVGKIDAISENRYGTVYRIVKYDVYANPRDSNRDTNEDASGTQAGRKQGQITEGTTSTPRTKDPQLDALFEEVWSVHPRGAKAKAKEEYRKSVPRRISHDGLLKALGTYVRTFQGDFSGAHLFRWIRDARWEEAEAGGLSNRKPEEENHVPRRHMTDEEIEQMWGPAPNDA